MGTQQRSAPPATAERRPVVLVVDDNDDTRLLYVEYLQVSGFRTEEASCGEDAVSLARAKHPELIVMDMSMPGLDGFEATRILKDARDTKDIPIIAVTGHCERHFRDRASDVGVDAFLTKPCLPSELLDQILASLATSSAARSETRMRCDRLNQSGLSSAIPSSATARR